jgi:hypothetical protein
MLGKTTVKTKLSFVALVVVMMMIVPASAFAGHGGSSSPELEVVGRFNPFGGVDGLTTDVWAYGNYAYIGSFDQPFCSLDVTGVRVIDISDPTTPNQVAFIADQPGTRTNDVKVAHIETRHFSGEILVATNEQCGTDPFIPRLRSNGGNTIPGQGGIAIWDVSDPTKPRALKQNFLENRIHNTYVWQDGDNAYLIAVDDVAVQDVIVVDITRPQAPRVIAVTGQEDWPDLNDNIGFGEVFLHDVWVEKNQNLDKQIAYLSYWDAGLVLLDVTNPANPVFLGDSDYPNPDPLSGKPPEGNSHVAVPNADGTRVLMGDEDFAAGVLTKFEFNGTPYPAAQGLFTKVVDPSFSGLVHDWRV